MGKSISPFSSFKQKENNLTNYCGLILKLIYEDNANVFCEIINDIVGVDALSDRPEFSQQEKTGDKIPDLKIKQNSFEIIFETKINDWFYEEQIEKYIKQLKQSNKDCKICLLLTNEFRNEDIEHKFPNAYKDARQNDIEIVNITFQELISIIEEKYNKLSNIINKFVGEFRDFLDTQNLLEKWKYTLDIVNCSRSIEMIRNEIYICPNSSGSYNHKRAKYFGAYSNKSINDIAEIKAIVVLNKDDSNEIRYKNTTEKDCNLIKQAKQKLLDLNIEIFDNGTQVFLLEKLHNNVNFIKESKGGLFASKFYINVNKDISNIEELFKKIKDRKWEDRNDIQRIFD